MIINAKRTDVIWTYLGVLMSLGSNFLLLPIIVYYLSGEELGLWYIFLSIGGIVSLFDFGFNPTIARNVTYAWSGAAKLTRTSGSFVENGEPNIGLLKKVICTCKRIYLLISLIALIILFTIGFIYIFYISRNMSGYNHIIAWVIYSIGVFLNLYYGYYNTFLRGVGAVSQINIATILAKLFQIIASVFLLYMGFGLVAVAIAYLGYNIIFRLITKSVFNRYQNIGKRINKDKTNVESVDIKEMFNLIWYNAWRDGLVSLSRYLSSQATVFISSMYLSLTAIGVYSISIQLVTGIATISGALYTAYQPSLQAAYINKDITRSKKMMSTAMTLYGILFWLGILALIFIGVPLITAVKPNTVFNISILIGIAVYEFLLKHHSYYASYISNTNNVPYMKSFISSSIIGIVFAFVLIRETNLGLWGLILPQIIVQAIYNNWAWPCKVMRSLSTNPIEMVKIGLREIFKLGTTKRYTRNVR